MNNSKFCIETTERLLGGKADNKSLGDIAKLHKVSIEHIISQFRMGVEIEHEHTTDNELAGEVAKDHLVEDPNYYSKLKKMEESTNSELDTVLNKFSEVKKYYLFLDNLLSIIEHDIMTKFSDTDKTADDIINYIEEEYNLTENLLPKDVEHIENSLR